MKIAYSYKRVDSDLVIEYRTLKSIDTLLSDNSFRSKAIDLDAVKNLTICSYVLNQISVGKNSIREIISIMLFSILYIVDSEPKKPTHVS